MMLLSSIGTRQMLCVRLKDGDSAAEKNSTQNTLQHAAQMMLAVTTRLWFGQVTSGVFKILVSMADFTASLLSKVSPI
jgi:hypothetical protein